MKTSEFIELKDKLKGELLRRKGFGSVAEYGDSAYDVQSPTPGSKVTADQGRATVDLLLAIEDYKDLQSVEENAQIPKSFNKELITEVQRLSTETMTGSSTSCRGDCTGLCINTCALTCIGSCVSTCSGCTSCVGGCASSCTGCCTNGCRGTCYSSCSGCRGSK